MGNDKYDDNPASEIFIVAVLVTHYNPTPYLSLYFVWTASK
jgi:hypothetical protein